MLVMDRYISIMTIHVFMNKVLYYIDTCTIMIYDVCHVCRCSNQQHVDNHVHVLLFINLGIMSLLTHLAKSTVTVECGLDSVTVDGITRVPPRPERSTAVFTRNSVQNKMIESQLMSESVSPSRTQ